MKRPIVFLVCLLSFSLAIAQVAEPQINKGTVSKPKSPSAPKKSDVYVTWKGSETQNFVFKVMNSKEESSLILKSGESGYIQLSAGYVTIESRHKGVNYFSSLVEIDPGGGRMTLTISGKDILVSYESEEDVRERERLAEQARLEELRKKEAERRKSANDLIDKAYDNIRSGNCDKAQAFYNSASSYMSTSESRMEQLYNSIRACRSHNAYEIAMDEAKGHKQSGYLSAALSAYQKALSNKSGDYEASKAINTVQSEMDRARSLESEGDRYFNAGDYSRAYSSYNSAYTIWSAKNGLAEKKDNAYYRMNKASGKAALDRGDYAEAIQYFDKAKTEGGGKNDSDIKTWESEAQYQLNKAKGETAMRNGQYFNAYEYFGKAKSYKKTDEIETLEREAINKTFDSEWAELIIRDDIEGYERFLKRWTKIPEEKEKTIHGRLYELEFQKGRKSFFSFGGGYTNFANSLKWLDKFDPAKKRSAERRLIRKYMSYNPEPEGLSFSYSLPVMLGYSITDTRENLNDVGTVLPLPAPALTNIERSGFSFFNRFNGGAEFRKDLLVPLGNRYLAIPYKFSLNYQNILAENASMSGLYDPQSDGYAALNQYQAYKDSIAAYKGENSWAQSNLNIGASIGYKFVNAGLNLYLDVNYNFGSMSYNSYETCTDCGSNLEYKQNFLSTGISLNWRDRLVLSYMNLNGLVRGGLDNPENTANLLGLELKLGDIEAQTRFSIIGQWYSVKTYGFGTTGQDPVNSLQQFRLLPTFNFRF